VKTTVVYRDNIEEKIIGKIKVSTTSDGHVIERYTLANGKKRYFATLAGTHWCAHGDTIADAISDAIWKDPSKRPSAKQLVKDIRDAGPKRKITLNEFRIITGACKAGCEAALAKAGRDHTPLTAIEIRDIVSKEWGNKLIEILEDEKIK